MVSGGCVVYCLNVTSRIKDYAFQINRLLQTEVKIRKIQAKKEKNAKGMALQRQEFCFLKKFFFNLTINMQLLYFITTVTSQFHSARHNQHAGYSALPSV